MTRFAQKPASPQYSDMRDTPGLQSQHNSEPRLQRTNETTESKDIPFIHGTTAQQPSTRSPTSQASSPFSLHQRRGAETTRSNTLPDPEPPYHPNTRPQPHNFSNHDRFTGSASTVSTSTAASTSGSGFSGRSTVPPSIPVRSQTYDPKSFSRREASEDPVTNQHRCLPSPNKLSSREITGLPLARTPSPQYGILDMPRSRFSQRVEAKTEALNGLRSRGSSPVRSESPTKGIPSVSPFARSESPTRNPSPTRSRGLPTATTSSPPSTNLPPFPPALNRTSVTPQSVTLQMATIGIGEDRNRGRVPDRHQVQRPSSPPKPPQDRTHQNGMTKSESGWPNNLPRLPRTPATNQHPNPAVNSVNGAQSATSTFASSSRPNLTYHSSASTSSSDRNQVRSSPNPSNHSNSGFSPREDERRQTVDLDLDDAPPPSLRSPSPASSVASSTFSSFSAAMESYRNGLSGSQFPVPTRDSHQRTGDAPVRQSTEPARTDRKSVV